MTRPSVSFRCHNVFGLLVALVVIPMGKIKKMISQVGQHNVAYSLTAAPRGLHLHVGETFSQQLPH